MPVLTYPALTDRQRAIVEIVRTYVAEHGYPPSIREIRDAVGILSTSTVHLDLVEIEKAGVIRRAGGRSRAIALAEDVAA